MPHKSGAKAYPAMKGHPAKGMSGGKKMPPPAMKKAMKKGMK